MLPPGSPDTGVALDVYNATKQPGDAKVMQHMVLLEPGGGEMAVSESFIWQNTGKTAFNDPDAGTLQFYAPAGAKGIQVNATAPQGMPIRARPSRRRQARRLQSRSSPSSPAKPTSTELHGPVHFARDRSTGKRLYKGGPTSIIVPNGVTLKAKASNPRR